MVEPGSPAGAEASEPPLGVVLIDPLPVVREGLGLLVETQSDMEVLAQGGSAEEGLTAVASAVSARSATTSGVVVALVALELEVDSDSFELIRMLRERFSELVLLASASEATRGAISKALAAGADGFIHKRADPVQFLEGLRRAASGETVITGLSRDLPPESLPTAADGKQRLTERQRTILALAADGLTARQIGSSLGLTERTVTTHLYRIYRKLGVSGRVAALRAATDRGLL